MKWNNLNTLADSIFDIAEDTGADMAERWGAIPAAIFIIAFMIYIIKS